MKRVIILWICVWITPTAMGATNLTKYTIFSKLLVVRTILIVINWCNVIAFKKIAILSTCLSCNWLLQEAEKVSGTLQTMGKMRFFFKKGWLMMQWKIWYWKYPCGNNIFTRMGLICALSLCLVIWLGFVSFSTLPLFDWWKDPLPQSILLLGVLSITVVSYLLFQKKNILSSIITNNS